jgi:hypothetical protein
LIGLVASAFVMLPQGDEDRPPIIVSSGSVILTVAKGNFARSAAGRYRQDVTNGKDVKSYSATTGTGTAACTVTGTKLVLTYGKNQITFERALPAVPAPQRHRTDVVFPATAKITEKDARTLEVTTTDALVSISNGGTRAADTCKIAGGKVEIKQVQ